jgi:hypothetical protein
MGKEDSSDLIRFLKPFPQEIQDRALWLRDFIWKNYPSCNELIYDNYNALAFGWSPTEKLGHSFCSVGVFRTNHNIHFGFFWGVLLSDPEKKLIGKGNQYRYIEVPDLKSFPKLYVKKLMREAFTNSMLKIKNKKDFTKGKTIVKSVLDKKRRKKP